MRKRAVILISTMAIALAVASGVVLAANINCEAGTPCVGYPTADTMTGTSQADEMSGLGGGDTMYGRGSDDTLSGGDGNDSLAGGLGGDSYVFGEGWGADTITSGEDSGVDILDFSSILDSLDIDLVPSADRDEVFSRAGMLNFPATVVIENVNGGKARDVVRGNDAPNSLSGKGGNDSLLGRGNNDNLSGGLGADAFNGGPGNDALTGSDASDISGGIDVRDVLDNDVYSFQDGWGTDNITDDVAGTDHLFFGELPSTMSVTVDLGTGKATAGTNTVTWTPSDTDIENATGGASIDTLRGNNSANTLNGQGGNDTIYGLGGVDKVSGDAYGLSTLTGDDTIHVEDRDPGDTVDCGPGNDTVFVDAKLNDLTPEPDDKIRLDTFFDEENCEQIEEILIN